MSISPRFSGIAAATFAAFCWGTATVMSKSALDAVSPMALLTLQLLSSAIALWTIIVVTRRPLPKGRARWVISALGLLEPGAAYLLGLIGLVWIAAGSATLIQASEAIMIVVISALVLKEFPSRSFVILSFVALGGLSLALGIAGGSTSENSTFGIFMVFLATGSAAVYVVLSYRAIGDYDPLSMVGLQQLSALGLALVGLVIEGLFSRGGIALPQDVYTWMIVILSGIIQYAVAFSAYMFALSRITANLAGSFLNLTPIFGLAIAFAALGEMLSRMQLVGAMITVLAVSLLHLQKEKAVVPSS